MRIVIVEELSCSEIGIFLIMCPLFIDVKTSDGLNRKVWHVTEKESKRIEEGTSKVRAVVHSAGRQREANCKTTLHGLSCILSKAKKSDQQQTSHGIGFCAFSKRQKEDIDRRRHESIGCRAFL